MVRFVWVCILAPVCGFTCCNSDNWMTMLSCCERDTAELGCFPFEPDIMTEFEASLTDGRSVTGEDKLGCESEDVRDQSLGVLL